MNLEARFSPMFLISDRYVRAIKFDRVRTPVGWGTGKATEWPKSQPELIRALACTREDLSTLAGVPGVAVTLAVGIYGASNNAQKPRAWFIESQIRDVYVAGACAQFSS
jgi:hypothetical protein